MELLWAIVGVLTPFVVGYGLSKVNPNLCAGLLTKALSKVLKNEGTRNRTENIIGFKLVEIGAQIISQTEEPTEAEQALVSELNKVIEKHKDAIK